MRALVLRPRFQRELRELAPRGSVAWTDVKRALAELADAAVLPGPDDAIVWLPYAVPSRSVPGSGLLIAYIPSHDEIQLIALVKGG